MSNKINVTRGINFILLHRPMLDVRIRPTFPKQPDDRVVNSGKCSTNLRRQILVGSAHVFVDRKTANVDF